MSDRERHLDPSAAPERETYVSPRIVWREAYQALSFGVSCAKQPGNPACAAGPVRK
jgi:hypothetical protein